MKFIFVQAGSCVNTENQHGTFLLNIFVKNSNTAQEMKFSNKDFFSKCDQICRKRQIWSHLLKKPLKEDFIFLCSERCLTEP